MVRQLAKSFCLFSSKFTVVNITAVLIYSYNLNTTRVRAFVLTESNKTAVSMLRQEKLLTSIIDCSDMSEVS